jgi:hypothetical protein
MMSERNFLYEAFIRAGEKLVNDKLHAFLNDLQQQVDAASTIPHIHFARESTPGTAIYPVIDSTAIVISDDMKALPVPKEGES